MATVVVMDDCEMVVVALHDALTEAGYNVLTASDGDQGIELCRKNAVAVVITDILMPGKEGIETIRELRRDYPHIEIIAISGGGVVNAVDCLTLATRFGATRTFSKPFRMAGLLEAVGQLCEAALARRSNVANCIGKANKSHSP